jgi:hypothetical protein
LKAYHGGRVQEMQFSDLKGQTWIPHKQRDNDCEHPRSVVSDLATFHIQ